MQAPSLFLAVTGPPGAPEALVVTHISDTTVQLSWGSGPDNHSPVTMYMVQARTPFSIGWQTVATGNWFILLICLHLVLDFLSVRLPD